MLRFFLRDSALSASALVGTSELELEL